MNGARKSRREFLSRAARGVGGAAVGGVVWAYLVREQAHASPFVLRPPGARDEADFLSRCIRCGQCVVDCPYHTLRLAEPGSNRPVGTPYFSPRDVPCYMCPDLPCVKACPTGALDPALTRVEEAAMGLAVLVDQENCLSYRGLRCEICHRECPVQNRAITIENHPRKTSKHAVFVPIVHSEACTGCGLCEKSCPLPKAAIKVLPRRLAQAKPGEHYRFGWTDDATITQEFEPAATAPPEASGDAASGLDYLNQELPVMGGKLWVWRWLILRRVVQLSILLAFYATFHWGWTLVGSPVLRGNLSASELLGTVPFADPFAVAQLLLAGGMVESHVLIGAAVVLLFYLLVGGRVFCSWVCPVNPVADLAAWLRRKLDLQASLRLPRATRYWAMGLTLVLSLALGTAAFEWISPIGMLHRGFVFGMGLGWVAVAALFVFDLLVSKQGWCGHLCPVGAFYGLLGRTAQVRVAFDQESCTQCGECAVVCPEPHVLNLKQAAEAGMVASGDCTNCGRCTPVCPEGSLSFDWRLRIQSRGRV